jgi:hypothetical protein
MMGHQNAWDYGWSFFILALDEAVKWNKPEGEK